MSVARLPGTGRLPDLSRVARVDEVGVIERTARFQTRSIKTNSKVEALRMVLAMIDLTTLEGQDTPGKVRQLCQKAMHLHDKLPDLPHVAAVCVYPTMVGVAKRTLGDRGINVASVATAFPSGMAPRNIKLEETRIAVEEGADEIDMVISRGAFLQGEYEFVFDEIAAIKEACGDAHLKVILERASWGPWTGCGVPASCAMHAGADFIKTSTGKIQPAATLPATLVMLQAHTRSLITRPAAWSA
ncbi:MAG: deoxyribose-phosphate aldolase [Woeseiaceae bacterium]|nr:deoxyribose-phosphate aldolase [Woeseiaceae bacterium]